MAGKEIRLRRLFRRTRLFIVPMDHGLTMGPLPGLQDVQATIEAVVKGGVDAVVVHKGLADRMAASWPAGCELIVHLSGSTALAPDPNRKELVATVEEAIRLGATAVSVHVNLGARMEAEMLKDLGLAAEACDRWGMPLLAMMYVRDGSAAGEYDPAKIKHAARVAEEIGADIVKVNYTGAPESFAEVVAGVRTPVIIAGGPRMDSVRELLEMVAGAVRAGASGVAIGRNVFQAADPAALAAEIRRILDGAA